MPRPTLYDHPKFRRLVFELKLPEPHVLGHLEYLWRIGYASGNPIIGDEVDVELAAMWSGERGIFCAACKKVGFIDLVKNSTFRIHDLNDHAPEYVKGRRRMELMRKKRRCNGYDDVAQHERNSSEKFEPPTPTPTPIPKRVLGGAGGNAEGGNLMAGFGLGDGVGGLGKDFVDRQLGVQSLLSRAGVMPEAQKELYGRRDITPEIVEREIAKLKKAKNVGDFAAVLVHRLRRHGQRRKVRN